METRTGEYLGTFLLGIYFFGTFFIVVDIYNTKFAILTI